MSTGPSFPPELWTIVLHNIRDLKSQDELTYLWTTVRQVCRQFKTEIEDIFRTEHLPKTFLHVHKHAQAPHSTQDGDDRSVPSKVPQLRYDSLRRFGFDGVHTIRPSSAVFSVHLTSIGATSIGPNVVKGMIKGIEAKTGPGQLGEADKTQSGSRVRLFENTAGLAVVQIRGGLHDCTLPSSTMDRGKRAISLDWRDLFTRFFGEKRMMDKVLGRAAVSDLTAAPSPLEARCLDYGPVPAYRLCKLRPALQASGQIDIEALQSYATDLQARYYRICHLSDPVHMWIITAGSMKSSSDSSTHSCQTRRKADQEIHLDDEGVPNTAKMEAQKEVEWGHVAAMKKENNRRGMTCDACRETDVQCKRKYDVYSMGLGSLEGEDALEEKQVDDLMLGGQAPCITCTAGNLRCEFNLADLNRGISRLIAGGPPERAYQERLMHLVQQGKQPTVSWPRVTVKRILQSPCLP